MDKTSWFINNEKSKREDIWEEFELVSEYINAKTLIKITHLVCGTTFMVKPQTFSRSSVGGCKTCKEIASKETYFKNHPEIEQNMQKDLPDGIELLDTFKGVSVRSRFRCNNCGSEFTLAPRDVIKTGHCTSCKLTRKGITPDVFRKQVEMLVGDEYTILSDYKKPHEKVRIVHNLCGHIYEVTPHNFKRGKRCPRCRSSHGEQIIKKVLDDMVVPYETQKKFEALGNLSYDFLLIDSKVLIEYQGEQHYKPVKLFGGEEQLYIQIKHDNAKREFARNNGYKLLEILYTTIKEVDIKNAIKSFI